MSNHIKRFHRSRIQPILIVAFIIVLVFGLPWVELNNRSVASNPSITATVTVSATAANPLLIPKGTNGQPISVPANLVVSVAEEVTFKAKGVPSGGTYQWISSPLDSSGNPPFYWSLPPNVINGYGPINSNGESIISKRFAIPGIYRAMVVYQHPQSLDVTAFVTVMVVDHTRVNFANNEYAPGNGLTGKPWSETPWIYPSYTSNYDSDNDGLPDTWEISRFGNLSQDWAGDLDGDGLYNARELALGTDGNDADSDGDGIPDGADLTPLTPNTVPLAAATTIMVWIPLE